MDSVLLATKLRIPPQPHHAIQRLQLIDTLERGIPDYRLCLISAPAGYGKTTLLAQWAHTTHLSIAWLSISEEDNDIEHFLRYLLKAWEGVQPDVMQSRLGLLLSTVAPDTDGVLSEFINAANTMPNPIVFVLDDYHTIDDAAIHRAMTFLVDHLPPNLHFVLAGRAAPPLPLARYRAHHELIEFGAEDLQFRLDETGDFLNDVSGLDLSDDAVAQLQTQLEGWIAGLQLVALSRERHLATASQLVVSGRHRFIADYLSTDVLVPLAPDLQQFLLQTSILESMCASLGDAITGRADSQALLEIVERKNLFLMPLDDSRQWFRYHRLFADFLHEALKRRYPDAVGDLHRRAAHWYLEHELPDPAFHHAVEGNDPELVAQVLDRYCNTKLNGGEIRVVGRWVDAIPTDWYSTHPVLGIARVGFLAFTGEFDAAVRYLNEVEQRLTPAMSDDLRWQMGRVTAVRCLLACTENDIARAEVYADHALQSLSSDDLNWRPGVYAALGDVYRRNARWDDAKACYLKALAITDSPELRFLAVHIYGALADLALRQGHLRDADGFWRKSLAIIQDRENWGRLEFPVIGWVYIRLGELLYEWNKLVPAWEYLSQGLEHAELGGDVRALTAGYLIAARLKLTQADIDAAAEYLERARPLVTQTSFSDWTSRFERLQLELWIAQGSLRTAADWAKSMLRSSILDARPESEAVRLAIVRVLVASGDPSSGDRALSLVKQLLATGEVQGRLSVVAEALALQALAHWKQGDRLGAMTALERALRLAEPEGFTRLFADLGMATVRLLQEARLRAVMPDYVAHLLAACTGEFSIAAPAEVLLPEPLSAREQEILELVAAGLTNQEIAERLVISPLTVKKHTGSIYSKFGVRSRTQAVARARALDLLT